MTLTPHILQDPYACSPTMTCYLYETDCITPRPSDGAITWDDAWPAQHNTDSVLTFNLMLGVETTYNLCQICHTGSVTSLSTQISVQILCKHSVYTTA